MTVPVLSLLLLALSPVLAKKPVDLDAVVKRAAADPAVVWSPDGARLAWKEKGKIVIFEVATGARREAVEIAKLEGDALASPEPEAFPWVNRGVREQEFQWSHDGARMLIAAKGDLFLLTLADGAVKQVTKTREREADPKLSPDSRQVSYRRGHDLYVQDVGSGKVTQLTRDGSATLWNGELDWVYPEELGIETAYWWSPDSKQIAYLQFDVNPIMIYPHGDLLKVRPVYEPERYPQAGTPNAKVRLGVVRASGGKTKWLASSDGDRLLARVTWLDGTPALAVHSLTRIQNKLDLLVVDAASGKSRVALTEFDAAWINLKDDYEFLEKGGEKGGRFIWGSERDGWRHLYLAPLDGGEPRRITQGEWEVTELACVDEKNERLYFVSTEASPLERHLYSVGFEGGGKRKLTAEPGTHNVTMAPGCGHYTDTWSSLGEPARKTLHAADGKRLSVLAEQDRSTLETYDILPNELRQFRGKDGTLFHARLIRPAGFEEGKKYPAIVQVYGGPHAQTVRDMWRGADWDQLLAHRGFVIWQMDNRGSAGRGHAWEAPLHRKFGKLELADQLEGVAHLISLGFVDPKRIGINGWSYGGYMTLTSLLHAPDTFRAGISGAPVTDWRHYDTIYTERYMGLPAENEDGYKQSSPVNFAANLKGKLMLVHNFEDDNVLFQHTLRMMDALQRADRQFEFMLYPQKSHAVTGSVRKQMLEGMTAFFERNLK